MAIGDADTDTKWYKDKLKLVPAGFIGAAVRARS